MPCSSPRLPHERKSAPLTSAVKAQRWAETETSGRIIVRKPPVTVTLNDRYLTTIPSVLLCAAACWTYVRVYFPFATGFFSKPAVARPKDHVHTSVHPPPPVSFVWIPSLSPVPPCGAHLSAYTTGTNSVQTNTLPIFLYKSCPKMRYLPTQPEQRVNRCTMGVGQTYSWG